MQCTLYRASSQNGTGTTVAAATVKSAETTETVSTLPVKVFQRGRGRGRGHFGRGATGRGGQRGRGTAKQSKNKDQKTPHIRITHLQAAVNSTRNLERVHIIVSCQQSAAGATLLHHLWRKIEKLTDLNKLQRMEKHLT